MSNSERWKAARTLAEFGDLTALWAEGELSDGPHNGGSPPDGETEIIRHELAILNRNGFVTDFSQPGMKESDWWQRASVTGFCDEETADIIRCVLAQKDLVVIPHGPDSAANYQYQIAITIAPSDESSLLWEERTWCGAPLDRETLHWYYRDAAPECRVHDDLLRALESAWQMTILDPVWGRQSLLWTSLLVAVGA